MGWLKWCLLVLQWLAYPVAVVTSLASLGHDDFWLRPEFARQVASESVVRKIERWQRREIRVARADGIVEGPRSAPTGAARR